MQHVTNEAPKVRHPKVEFSQEIPKYWAGGDPMFSAFFAALSTIFPDGERFFIFSLRNYLDQISDPGLKEAMRGFIGQEAMHGRIHQAYNQWLAQKGYPMEFPLMATKQGMLWLRKTPPKVQLACTAAFEHFTALFGEFVTNQDPEAVQEMATWDPTMYKIWLWHGIEENEHKSVAFDAFQNVGGSYVLRSAVMLVVSLFVMLLLMVLIGRFLQADGQFRPSVLYHGLKRMWSKPGYLRKAVLPWLAFFKPGFHPWERDNRKQLEAMLLVLEREGLFADLLPAKAA